MIISIERTDIPKEKRKIFTYNVRRVKLDKPITRKIGNVEFVNRYKIVSTPVKKKVPECKKQNKKSSGPMSTKRITKKD